MAGISKEERTQLLRSIKTADDNFKRGMYALAEPTYRRALDVLGDGAAEICDCIQNLAQICIERKDLTEALKLRIRLLLLLEERFGGDHVKTISLMDDIAGLYEQLGRTEESRDMYERARKASERSLWADQQNEGDTMDDAAIGAASGLNHDFQYSETAKSALETDDSHIVEYDFDSPSTVPEGARNGIEDTIKLPQMKNQVTPAPPPKDPQLETLILNRKDVVLPTFAENKIGKGSAPPVEPTGADPIPGNPNASQSGITAAKPVLMRSDPSQSKIAVSAPASLTTNNALPESMANESPAIPTESTPTPQTNKLPTNPNASTAGIPVAAPEPEPEQEWKTYSSVMRARPSAIKADEDHSAEESTELVPLDKEALEQAAKNKASVDAKAANDDDEKKAVSVNLFQSKKQRNIVIGVLAGCFGLLIVASLFAGHGNPDETYRSMPHRYRTVDGEKLFFLSSPTECEMVAGAETAKMRYNKFHSDFKDTFGLLFGPLTQHQLSMKKTKSGLTDETGSVFFAEGSPELDLAEEMEAVARNAELAYLKTHHYPKKLDELDAAKRQFRNPFTGQLDKPVVQFAQYGKKTQNDDGGMRKKLYDTALSGARWTNEPKRHPGEISCLSAVIHTKKGDINTFYVRGFDRDSRPLLGHNSFLTHAIVLENNKTKPIAKAQLPFKSKSTARPRFVWLIDESALPNPVWVKFGGAILLTFLSFAAGITSLNINSKAANALLKITTAICALLAVVCLLSDMIP